MLIIVDCGMTNMRCRLISDGNIVAEVKKKSLVSSKEAPRLPLIGILTEAVGELLTSKGMTATDVQAIVCSGILASDVGIHRVPHVMMPAGVHESALGAQAVRLPEYPQIPFLFIPGVRTAPISEGSAIERLERLDSMSGEECETYGIMKLCGIKGDFTLALPGTYNKALYIDHDGKISVMQTGMCGDFMAAIANNTILRHTLPSPLISEIIEDKLCFGFDYAEKHGTSPSVIMARNATMWGDLTREEGGNFFVGAALHDDIVNTAEVCRPGIPLYVGGSDPLRHVFTILLKRIGVTDVIELPDSVTSACTEVGASEVFYEYLRIHGGITV